MTLLKWTKQIVFKSFLSIFSVVFLPLVFIVIIISRVFRRRIVEKRLVWGSTPIISNSYWSRAMAAANFKSETFTTDFYSTINNRNDWDRILSEEYSFIWSPIKPFFAFLESLFRYDVFFISFNGFFLGRTPLRFLQAQLLKLAGKKIVVIPYGSDSYVYRNIRSTSTIHGLLMSYPKASHNQHEIAADVNYWSSHAHAVIPGIMGPDGFGRWDVLIPCPFALDLTQWKVSTKDNPANGLDGEVTIIHAPNHRGFKGTEFLINAVDILRAEGLQVQLLLMEKIQNSEVRRTLENKADILVEQLIATGHALNALEGMASGLTTVCNLEDENYILPMCRWSYFNECPLVSATPENLVDVLRKLVTRPELRKQLGKASREYVEKYHGLDSAQYLFTNVIKYVYGSKESLINLYHPLLGEYPNRSPKIQHPLVNNRIVDK